MHTTDTANQGHLPKSKFSPPAHNIGPTEDRCAINMGLHTLNDTNAYAYTHAQHTQIQG